MTKAVNFMNMNDKIDYPTPRSEGSAAIASMMKKLKNEKKLIVGINATNRAILQDKVKIVVIASNQNPPILTDHILFLCSQKKIPVITSAFSPKDLGKELNYRSIATAAILNSTEKDVIDLLIPYADKIPKSSFHLFDENK